MQERLLEILFYRLKAALAHRIQPVKESVVFLVSGARVLTFVYAPHAKVVGMAKGVSQIPAEYSV